MVHRNKANIVERVGKIQKNTKNIFFHIFNRNSIYFSQSKCQSTLKQILSAQIDRNEGGNEASVHMHASVLNQINFLYFNVVIVSKTEFHR